MRELLRFEISVTLISVSRIFDSVGEKYNGLMGVILIANVLAKVS